MKIVNGFNHADSLLVITSYPDPTTGIKGLNAVAWHARKTLLSLAKERKIHVLAERIGRRRELRDGPHGNIKVSRLWNRRNPLSLLLILYFALISHKVRQVLIQFEFNTYGGNLAVLIFPLLLTLLKLSGKSITMEIHEVVTDISPLSSHINVKNPLMLRIINTGLAYFYRAVGANVQSIVVFENELKERLARYVDADKIEVIPLSTTPKRLPAKITARARLDLRARDFVVLVFGFVNWYKGSDWIIKAVGSTKPTRVKLVMAGGPSFTLGGKSHYDIFYKKIQKDVENYPNITLTGFVQDEDVSTIFATADIVVIPYRTFMSASGPLSLALSFKKPVLLSDRLKDYDKSHDIRMSRQATNISEADLFFPLSKRSFQARIEKLRKDKKYLRSLNQFSLALAKRRHIREATYEYERLLLPYTKKSLAYS